MILITGCAGFIGSTLCEELITCGESVVGIDNFDPYYDESVKRNNLRSLLVQKRFHFIQGDIVDPKTVQSLLASFKISRVAHLAARPGVSRSLLEPILYTKINMLGTQILLEAVKDKKLETFIFASSSSVYGGTKKIPFSEEDPCTVQLSPYGASKRAGEILCNFYRNVYSVPITVLRLFTVYGPRVRPDMAMYKFIRLISEDKELTLYNEGKATRDYTYISDIVRGIQAALSGKGSGSIINLGNNCPVAMKYIVETIGKTIGKKPRIKNAPLPIGEMTKTWADIGQAKKLLGWKPMVSMEEGIAATVQWYIGSNLDGTKK